LAFLRLVGGISEFGPIKSATASKRIDGPPSSHFPGPFTGRKSGLPFDRIGNAAAGFERNQWAFDSASFTLKPSDRFRALRGVEGIRGGRSPDEARAAKGLPLWPVEIESITKAVRASSSLKQAPRQHKPMVRGVRPGPMDGTWRGSSSARSMWFLCQTWDGHAGRISWSRQSV